MVGGDGQATVTLAAPSSGGAVASYTVTAADSTTSVNGGQTCTVVSPATSCTITGLTDGDSYTFSATATNTSGTSGASAASNTVIPQVAVPGTPGTPTVVVGSGQATVTPAAPSSGGPVVSYTVTAADSTTSVNGGQICTVTSPATSCTIIGLTNGDSYTFSATATNAGGTSTSSAPSTPAVPQPAPGCAWGSDGGGR